MPDLPAESLAAYERLWTTEKDCYSLVRVEFPDGRSFHDIYHLDGTYSTLADDDLNRSVVERMRAAGVPVLEPDAWVLSQKLKEFEYLWTSGPNAYLVVRYLRPDELPRDVIYDEGGDYYSVYEEAVRHAVVERMIAAGAQLIAVDEARIYDGDGFSALQRQGDDQLAREHDEDVNGVRLFSLLIQPSFEAWSSWRLFRIYPESSSPFHVVRFLTWRHGSPLSFRERVRLPYAEQGWSLRWIRNEVPLDNAYCDQMLARLSRIQAPAFASLLYEYGQLGCDGTSYRLTAGSSQPVSEWVWWEEGPEEWKDLIGAVNEVCVEFERRRLALGKSSAASDCVSANVPVAGIATASGR